MTYRHSEICKKCSPQGGAIFTATWDDDMNPVKKCNCCGTPKPFRKPTAKRAADIAKREAFINSLAEECSSC